MKVQFVVVPTREPVPTCVQVAPLSALRSNVAELISGALPPRVQFTSVGPTVVSVCVAESL